MMKTQQLPLPPLACIILAAGQGTRMRSDLPKVMHPLAGMPMIAHVVRACESMTPEQIVVVTAPHMDQVAQAVAPHPCVHQLKPLGTGDAVKAARKTLKDFHGDIIVLCGDAPLITSALLRSLQKKRQETKASLVIAGFTPEDPASYGRLILDAKGNLTSIVEAAEATPKQRTLGLCNSGVILFASDTIWTLLDKIRDDNSKKEFYLTDCVSLARAENLVCAVAEIAACEVQGINTRVELAHAEKLMQKRLREKAMLSGVTMLDPETVYLSADTEFGRDVVISPNVYFGLGVSVGDKAEIKSFCYLEQVRVEEAATIGPFAKLRPGTVIGVGAHIGSFVELKNTEVGKGAKIPHLSYIGDASVGAKANIGAGTITCNYDGFRKYHTEIGAEAFIGSNSSLVAPVKIGDGAYVGAGSVITQEVPAHTLAVARGRQSNVENWAQRFRDEKAREKDGK